MADPRIIQALTSLFDKQRIVFNLKYFEEKPYTEISQLLHTSEGALKASYHIAVKKIELFFAGQDKLEVWVDKDGDGQSEAGELRSLKDMGNSEVDVPDQGPDSTFTMNGKKQLAEDYIFDLET